MIYKITQPSALYGDLMPAEDSLLQYDNIFCVADGITRDPISPKDFTDKKPEEILKKYPNPSGAKFAADLFCKTFVKSLKDAEPSKEQVKKAFITANKNIAKLNKKHFAKIDYLVNDFFACVAVGGVIHDNKLYWGGICDCGIIIYSKNGAIKFQTDNWMSDFINYENNNLKTPEFNWTKPKYRKLVRSEFRNNPNKIVDGKLISYGAMTGEKNVEKFMNFGVVELKRDDLIIFFSDGFEDTVNRDDFFKHIHLNTNTSKDDNFLKYTNQLAKENYAKFGRERSLIAVINKTHG